MVFECKIFDKKGKLKKVLRGNEAVSKKTESFFEQKSTKKAASFIKKLREPPKEKNHETKFYNNVCVVCGRQFHPRHPQSKYCSHECQKSLYLKNRRLKKEKQSQK